MKANAGEVYTVYNQYLKRYTACQVAYIAPPDTVSKESWAVVLSLDWVGDASFSVGVSTACAGGAVSNFITGRSASF